MKFHRLPGTNRDTNFDDNRFLVHQLWTRRFLKFKFDPRGIFHEERTVNLASRVLTSHIMKNDPPRDGHVFQRTGTIFKLVQDIIETNLLANIHDDQTIKVASRGLSFSTNHIIGINLVTKFHEDWTLNVASRLLTSYMIKNAPPPGGHVLQPTLTIFRLVQNNIWTHFLKNAPPSGGHSRVLTRFYYSHIWPYY
ncbi:hypothetical protein DPMN_019482 [Dreissena polymorpha]|uniref:Uncharacterized protein n=1 Tax=Dreissena polymorpha TaxID=45954 RepID=A0A9D4S9B9_DREPO|nr:hypothetical protein DPMN_019482 [Dreissena polymorpha]